MDNDEQEVPLSGAGLQDRELVRVGATVRRPAGRWTESVQRLLRDLRGRGFDLVPEPFGIDSAGREVLGYIEGRDQGWLIIPEILGAEGVRQLGRLAARLRSALAGYGCPADARWQFAEGTPRSGETLQHGDLGPWNLLWGASYEVVGVLDWDFVGPGDPWYDTGHLAWFTVPLMDDQRAHARGFPEPPDRQSRLAAFAGGAGISGAELVEVALRAQEEYERRVLTRGCFAKRRPVDDVPGDGLSQERQVGPCLDRAPFRVADSGTRPPATPPDPTMLGCRRPRRRSS